MPGRNAQTILFLNSLNLCSPFRHSWLNKFIKTEVKLCQFFDQNCVMDLYLTTIWNENPCNTKMIYRTPHNLQQTTCFLPSPAFTLWLLILPHLFPGSLPVTYRALLLGASTHTLLCAWNDLPPSSACLSLSTFSGFYSNIIFVKSLSWSRYLNTAFSGFHSLPPPQPHFDLTTFLHVIYFTSFLPYIFMTMYAS